MAGKYVELTSSDHEDDCIDCVLGKYVESTGSDEAGDCIECDAGKYINVTGSDEATDFPTSWPGSVHTTSL